MASKDFSNKLKDLRLKAGYSQKEVYEHFKIPQSTFSSWEVGKSEPSGEMFIKLCEFYKCDMVKEFSADEALNYKEWNIIEQYRSLDDAGKIHINYELNREVKRVEKQQEQSKYILKLLNGHNGFIAPYADAPDTLEALEEQQQPENLLSDTEHHAG